MSSVKSLLVGVSTYDDNKFGNLPYCKGDMHRVHHALVWDLEVPPQNVKLLGNNNRVGLKEFLNGLAWLSRVSEPEDTLMLYFSGHGEYTDKNYYLVFSDTTLESSVLAAEMKKLKFKNLLIILDCCHAGGMKVLDMSSNAFGEFSLENIGKGVALFTSCNNRQVSGPHPEQCDVSFFTYCLTTAIHSVSNTTHSGPILFSDIKTLTLNIMTRIRQSLKLRKTQTPTYKTNIIGDIEFNRATKMPRVTPEISPIVGDGFTIYDINTKHILNRVHYTVTILVHDNNSPTDTEIRDIYEAANEIMQRKFPDVNLLIYFFALTYLDMLRDNFYGKWINLDDCDRTGYIGKTETFVPFTQYHSIRNAYESYIGNADHIILSVKQIVAKSQQLVQEFKQVYGEYIEKSNVCKIDRGSLKTKVTSIRQQLQEIEQEMDTVSNPPMEILAWCDKARALLALSTDVTLVYTNEPQFQVKRTKSEEINFQDNLIKNHLKVLAGFNNTPIYSDQTTKSN